MNLKIVIIIDTAGIAKHEMTRKWCTEKVPCVD